MTTPSTIVIATTNQGKLREVRAVLSGLPCQLASLADYPGLSEAVEDADTFAGNAALKATHYARFTGAWALADDSGLEVDALDGAPGVHSARYAGTDADDAANNTKLIAALANVPQPLRTARFRCAMALANADGVVATGCGVIEGFIVDEPRGDNGFGYDPYFLVPDVGKTSAELTPDHKNRISHRGRALADILPALQKLLACR